MILKIEFLCGSIEKGKDGVGDYTRLLASSLADYNVTTNMNEYNYWKGDLSISDNNNILYSWQFVPYAYNSKGIVWPAVKPVLAELKKGCVHIMLHELWIGGVKTSTFKNKIIGYFQKRAIKKMLQEINPSLITTSTHFYKACLKEIGFESEVLPIFSNIPKGNKDAISPLWTELSEEFAHRRKEYFIIILFGNTAIYDNINNDIEKVFRKINLESKKIIVAHIGKCNDASKLLETISARFACQTHVFGLRTESEVADILAQSDLGLSTYPKILYQKSGTIAAMLYNSLPVVLIREGFLADLSRNEFVKEIDEVDDLCQYSKIRVHNSDDFGVKATVAKYRDLLNKHIK